jgi:hypothetical protein
MNNDAGWFRVSGKLMGADGGGTRRRFAQGRGLSGDCGTVDGGAMAGFMLA